MSLRSSFLKTDNAFYRNPSSSFYFARAKMRGKEIKRPRFAVNPTKSFLE